jgi:hypothetical protein
LQPIRLVALRGLNPVRFLVAISER